MTSESNQTTHPANELNIGLAALWASAFVIMAMIIVQAGKVGVGNEAGAGMTANIANLRLLTSRSNNDEEVFSILDESDETLSAYLVVNGRSLEMFDSIPLPQAFERAAGAQR